MNLETKALARYHMPRRFTGEDYVYDGRIHIQMIETPDARIIAWCKAQPFVVAVQSERIDPTSLLIWMEALGERPDGANNHLHDFLQNLSREFDLPIRPQGVTTVRSSLQQLRAQGPPAYTQEMQFLTEEARQPEYPFRQPRAVATTPPYGASRRRRQSFKAWRQQERRWGGRYWFLKWLAYYIVVIPVLEIFVTPWLRMKYMHDLLCGRRRSWW